MMVRGGVELAEEVCRRSLPGGHELEGPRGHDWKGFPEGTGSGDSAGNAVRLPQPDLRRGFGDWAVGSALMQGYTRLWEHRACMLERLAGMPWGAFQTQTSK